MPFEFEKSALDGIVLIQPKRFGDARGSFEECYHRRDFEAQGIHVDFVQDNTSFSIKGTIRGLHFQKAPHGQAKLLKVLNGRVLDVAVDIREHSATFGKHIAIELSAESGNMIYIPEGFAHGFSVLSETAIVHYKTSNYYHPQAEGGIFYRDPELAIDWKTDAPLVSPKDEALPLLNTIGIQPIQKDIPTQA